MLLNLACFISVSLLVHGDRTLNRFVVIPIGNRYPSLSSFTSPFPGRFWDQLRNQTSGGTLVTSAHWRPSVWLFKFVCMGQPIMYLPRGIDDRILFGSGAFRILNTWLIHVF